LRLGLRSHPLAPARSASPVAPAHSAMPDWAIRPVPTRLGTLDNPLTVPKMWFVTTR